jgi:hypothetical protein
MCACTTTTLLLVAYGLEGRQGRLARATLHTSKILGTVIFLLVHN